MSTLAVVLAAAALAGAEPLFPNAVRLLPVTPPPAVWPAGTTPKDAAPADKPDPQDKWVEAFPHVRVNRGLKTVELDGKVAWDFHNPDTPRTELELLVCLPLRDKEHESLVASLAKGAHVHAAMLLAGLEPGQPGRIEFGDDKDPTIKRHAPTGPRVTVSFVYTKDGKERVDNPRTWVVDEAENKELAKRPELAGRPYTFVFGGSKVGQMRNEQGEKVSVYNADELGTLIGLCTFGSETIGITRVYSPDSGLDAPNFTANNAAVPPFDTPVRVRIAPDTSNKIEPEDTGKASPTPR